MFRCCARVPGGWRGVWWSLAISIAAGGLGAGVIRLGDPHSDDALAPWLAISSGSFAPIRAGCALAGRRRGCRAGGGVS